MADSQEYRSRFFFSNFVFLGILLGILVVVFALRDLLSGGKMDLTADKVYTISPATKDILGELIDDIIVRFDRHPIFIHPVGLTGFFTHDRHPMQGHVEQTTVIKFQ